MKESRLFTEKIGKDKLVECLEGRLRWLTYGAADEEFDMEEVEAIVSLLMVLEPIQEPEYFNAEKALERFWKYYDQRKWEEEYLDKIREVEEGMHTDTRDDIPDTEM